METQNITLSLPKDLVRKAKLVALEKGTSISGLLREYLIAVVAQEDRYARARQRDLEVLRLGANLGTRGTTEWTREELHQR